MLVCDERVVIDQRREKVKECKIMRSNEERNRRKQLWQSDEKKLCGKENQLKIQTEIGS